MLKRFIAVVAALIAILDPVAVFAQAAIQGTGTLPEAPYLLYDNFTGSPTALNGKAPVLGNGANTYQVTGAQLANAISGNGNAMLNVASGNAYVSYQLASAPGEIGFTFELAQAVGSGTPTVANSGSQLVNIATWSGIHPQVTLTSFSTNYFLNGTGTPPAWVDQNVYATLSTNTIYTVRAFIEAPYVHMYLFDPTGAQIGYQIDYDPNYVTAVGGGTWVFFQLFDGAASLVPFGVTYHSWWARAKQTQSASNTYYRGGIDQSPLGLRTQYAARFSSVNVGKGTPSGKFSVTYDDSAGDAVPAIANANPAGADSIIKLRSTGPNGGAQYQFANAGGQTGSLGILNDSTQYLLDHNGIQWWFRPPYSGAESSRYPTTPTCVRIGGTAGPYWCSGAGAPATDAPIGSLYSNTSGGATTTLYVKTAAGAGGWTAK